MESVNLIITHHSPVVTHCGDVTMYLITHHSLIAPK